MREKLIEDRLKKSERYKELFKTPYPARVRRTHTIREALRSFRLLSFQRKNIALAGRLLSLRDHGKIVFADLMDESGTLQLVFTKEATRDFDEKKSLFDPGDFVEAGGCLFTTRKAEKSLRASHVRLIAKCIKPWPSSWYGLEDVEERQRRRYLDFIFNPASKEKVHFRSRLVSALRRVLTADGFLEVETPVLQPLAGGATARPFETHFHALDSKVYLRIAPELYLKRLLVAGFEKIFEIGKDFRNEGIDRDHYPEFTMLELYWAYQDY